MDIEVLKLKHYSIKQTIHSFLDTIYKLFLRNRQGVGEDIILYAI